MRNFTQLLVNGICYDMKILYGVRKRKVKKEIEKRTNCFFYGEKRFILLGFRQRVKFFSCMLSIFHLEAINFFNNPFLISSGVTPVVKNITSQESVKEDIV